MARETAKTSSQSEHAVSLTEKSDYGHEMKKPEEDENAERVDRLCNAETLKKPDPIEKPERHAMNKNEPVATTEKPRQKIKTEDLGQDRPGEKPVHDSTTMKQERESASEGPQQNDTAEKLDPAGTSKKDERQSNNPNKRLRFGPSQRNKSGPKAKNGSYRNYYKRRYNGIHGDDRLPIVRDVCKLQGKNISILDIGCNDGTVTIEMASMDRCVEAVGVDIDPSLVGAARKKLQEFVEKETSKSETELANSRTQGPIPKLHDSLSLSLRSSLQLMKEAKKSGKEDGTATENVNVLTKFPRNMTFRREDFAQKAPTRTSQELEKYDVVLCLSVTKWVHFAGGDEGLKRLFHRLHACLKPGGVLVLEPQPQKSYKSAIRKGLGKKDIKGERKLLPQKFPDYLTKTVGFGEMRMLRDVRHQGQAFNRPIMAFYKRQVKSPEGGHATHCSNLDSALGYAPSDDEGDEERHPETQSTPEAQDVAEAQDTPEDQPGTVQNGMVYRNIHRSMAEEVRQEGEEHDKEGASIDKNDSGCERENEEREHRIEPESRSGRTSVRRNLIEDDTSVPYASETKEEGPSQTLKTPSPNKLNCENASPPSAGSKRRSTGQELEGIKAQSSKRSKQDEEKQNDQKSPSEESD